MDGLDIIQTLTEVANLSVSVKKMSGALADSQTKLQLARSAIQTAIHELGEYNTSKTWVVEYLNGVLENLKWKLIWNIILLVHL